MGECEIRVKWREQIERGWLQAQRGEVGDGAKATPPSVRMSIASHFAGKDPTVQATYRRLIEVARTLGPVSEEVKKTSIHLVRRAAFAGVATRRSSLILTLKSATDIRSPRIEKREQTSTNRWHVEVRLEEPAHIDRQLTLWLKTSYELAGPRS